MKKYLLVFVLFPLYSFAQEKLNDLFSPINNYNQNLTGRSSGTTISTLTSAQILNLNTANNKLVRNTNIRYQITIPTKNDGNILIELEPVEILSPGFQVLTPNGEYKMEPPTFYRGRIVGKQKSFVAITATSKSFEGLIISDNYNYTIGPIKNDSNGYHIVYKTEELPNNKSFTCEPAIMEKNKLNIDHHTNNTPPQTKSEIIKSLKKASAMVGTVKVYMEAEYQMYVDWGYSVPYVVSQMTSIFNNVSLLFANESIDLQLSSLFVWTSTDPYAGATSLSDALYLFSQKPSFNADLAHLVTTRNIGGGLAMMGIGTPVYGNMTQRAVFRDCSDQYSAYGASASLENNALNVPTYSWNVGVIAHELGHNFGLPHTHSCNWPGGAIDNCGYWIPEGDCPLPNTPTGSGTIMSYCHITNVGINFLNGFGQKPGDKMRAEVAAATCLSKPYSAVDYFALRAFYLTTNGDNWTNKTGWATIRNNPTPPANFTFTGIYGVTSAVFNGRERVTKIELPANNLNGIFPTALSYIVNLETLTLNNNQISGSIPGEIGLLLNLKKLNLSQNQLSGSIPSQLGNLVNLRELNLNNNQLSGCYNSNLKALCNRLTTANISNGNNGLAASWPNFCASNQGVCVNIASAIDYTALRDFYIATNGDTWTNKTGWEIIKNNATPPVNYSFTGLFGITSSVIEGVERVAKITIINNNLTGSLSTSLQNITYLEELVLSSNKLTGAIPAALGNAANLKHLNLYDNLLTGAIPTQVGNLTKLEHLFLSNNHLTGPIPTSIGNLTKLMRLGLDNNQLTGAIPSQIGNLTNLQRLNFSNNLLTGSIPIQIDNLVYLQTLDINTNQLTGSIPVQIGNLTRLISLNLRNNKLTGSIPEQIGNLRELFSFEAHTNQLTGSIPNAISNLIKLQYLWLNDNQLTGTIPASLGNLAELMQLSLYNNQLTGSIPNQLASLTKLVDLALNNNQLSGQIPEFIGNFVNMRFLSLGSNQFTGSIPAGLSNLTNLTFLNLGYNQLTGTIPVGLGNLSNLTGLVLSLNTLSGSIPKELGQLSLLTHLGLEYNQLSGSIPSELGNLANLNSLYIQGNQFSGCYATNLKKLCNISSILVSEGNTGSLLATWSDFCASNAGACSCPETLTLQSPTDDLSTGVHVFVTNQSTGQITATNKITGTANLTLQAGKSIVLAPGFKADQGTVFKVEKGGCPN